MAEEEEKTEVEEESEAQGPVPKKAFPVNIIIACFLGLFLLGGGFMAWKSGLLSKPFKKEGTQSSDIEETKKEIGPIYSLETFIVNLIGGRGKNYLKAKIDLELDSEKATEEIEKRLPQFRDSILTMLSSKSHEDVKTLEGKFQLRAEIISMLNQYLKKGKIRNVYFTDFIVQ